MTTIGGGGGGGGGGVFSPRLVEGAQGETAYGVVVSRADLMAKRAVLAARAEALGGLRLSLTPDRAVFWSVGPVDLPWFPDPLFYLGPPRDRIFAPIQRRLDLPALLTHAFLATLSGRKGAQPPFLAAPSAQDPTRPTLIALGEGASLGDVDWAALARELAPRGGGR